MKKVLFLLALLTGLVPCSGGVSSTAQASEPEKAHVEVVYFHGKQRCATCLAIEKEAKMLVGSQFADEVKKGKVAFRAIDISDPKNNAVAESYQVTWSSLYVTTVKGGKEMRENLTQLGFRSARNNPETFRKVLSEKINAALK